MIDAPQSAREAATTLISGSVIVTMDAQRRIISDGALAIRGDRIVGVGKRQAIETQFDAAQVIDGRRFVMTPGFVDAHIHITGDPLTRGFIPDDINEPFADKLARWVIPRFLAHTAEDERLSAQLASLQMLRSGTTCFLEAGTIRYLDAVVDGLQTTGIRGRVGAWVEGRAQGPADDQAQSTDRAIRVLEDEVTRFPARTGARIAAWPILLGHTTNPDEVWKAAKHLADQYGLGVSAHMSPYAADAEWYLKNVGRRPVEHLAHIGVLGHNLSLTHVAHVSSAEVELLAKTRTNAIFCPESALKGAFGVSVAGRFPEMSAAGVNIALGTDGDLPDLMDKMSLAAAVFKDARRDPVLFPAHQVLEMAITGGACLMQLQGEIGALEVGKKADFVLHDTDRPEWRPLLNPLHQLVWSADGRSVHSVWVDGVRVVNDYRCTLLDEQELYQRAQAAARELLARSGVPARCAWPLA
jgi:cytosine/adenosine deaminase-related metal-dependent hydrolase